MDGRHLFLLTLVILPMLYCSSDEEYILQQEFERALNTTSNIYTLQKNFQPDSDASVVCIPVDYNVTCKDPCLNQSSTINCTGSGYQVSYLWTSFDTKTIPGDLLLHWAISGVRILGFEWADKCSHSSKNAIALNLNVNTLPCVSDPESAIAALESVTKELKAFAESQGVPSDSERREYSGYAVEWHDNTDTSKGARLLNGLAGVLSVFSLLVMVSLGPTVYDKINGVIQAKKNLMYLYFWSFQSIAFIWCWGGLIYLLITLDGTLTALVFYDIYVVMILDVFLALWIVWKRLDRLFPVPFICGCCCGCCYNTFLPFLVSFISNVFAIWNIFAFLTFVLYALPSVALAYYVFPSRSLIRLSYMQFAVIVLVVAASLFLFLLEKLCLMCFVKCNEKLSVPQENHSININDTEKSLQDFVQVDIPDVAAFPEAKTASFQDGRISRKELLSATIHALTSVIFLIGVAALVCAIALVILKQTASESKSISGYLTILPTVAMYVTLWIAQKKIFVPDELKSLGQSGAKRLQDLLKARRLNQGADEETVPIISSGTNRNEYSSLP